MVDAERAIETVAGETLRTFRRGAGATQSEIGRLMGVSHQRIANLESQARVPLHAARRYLAALAELVAATSEPAGQ